jgi:hypothetical protein
VSTRQLVFRGVVQPCFLVSFSIWLAAAGGADAGSELTDEV